MIKVLYRCIIYLFVSLFLSLAIYVANTHLGFRQNGSQEPSIQSAEGTSTGSQQPQQGHRPVVVQYADSTFGDTDRSGFRSEKAEYYAAVSYVTEEESAELPAGQKRLTVTTALGNLSGPSLIIEWQMLALVSSAGKRYSPVPDDGNSEVLGVQLNEDQGVYGFLGFNVPTDFSEGVLEWCPDGAAPCPQPIRAPLP